MSTLIARARALAHAETESPEHVRMRVARERVASGMCRLDRYLIPSDWRRKISLERLRIQSASTCVLGQLFGDYTMGLAMLGIETHRAHLYGFSEGTRCADLFARHSCAHEPTVLELDEAWREALTQKMSPI